MDDVLEQLRKNAAERERLLAERDALLRRGKAERLATVVDMAAAADLSRVHVQRILKESAE